MWVIEHSFGYRGLDRTRPATRCYTYAGAMYYIAKREAGKKSIAKDGCLWHSEPGAWGVTRFDTEADAQDIIDRYPNGFPRCKPVDLASARARWDAQQSQLNASAPVGASR
jgi:hypothetical protein